MARPEKCKRICSIPENKKFICETKDGKSDAANQLTMTMEEFETIRLIDYIGLTQEQCAEQMAVARTTVQRIYNEARRKLAGFLISGAPLEIQGGSYIVCERTDSCCNMPDCPKRKCGCSCDAGQSYN